MDSFIEVARSLGLPTAMLAALLFGLWQVARWAASHVVEPLVQSHTQFVLAIQEALKKQTETLEEIAEYIRQQRVSNAAEDRRRANE